MLEIAAQLAGYAALTVLAFLLMANVMITVARLAHNRGFASRIAALLAPFAQPFRLGSSPPERTVRHNS